MGFPNPLKSSLTLDKDINSLFLIVPLPIFNHFHVQPSTHVKFSVEPHPHKNLNAINNISKIIFIFVRVIFFFTGWLYPLKKKINI